MCLQLKKHKRDKKKDKSYTCKSRGGITEELERKDKSYTCNSRGGITEELELTIEYLFVLYQRVVSY